MVDTKFSICSRASVAVGCKPIASFEDGTTESTVAADIYDARVEELIGEHDWRFTQTWTDLGHLADAPGGKWADAWQLPSDFLRTQRVELAGVPLTEFEIVGDQLHCDVDEDQVLSLQYQRQVGEDQFPPWFKRVLEHRLSADFAGSVREDAALAELHYRRSEMRLLVAKRNDRLLQPAKRLPVGRLKAARL